MTRLNQLVIGLVIAVLLIAIGLGTAVRVVLSGDRIKAAIEAQATSALGHTVTIASAEPRFFPHVALDLSGVAIGDAREGTIERIRLTTGLGALLKRRVADAEITVQRSRIDIRWALAMITAFSASTPTTPTAASAPLTIDSIGSLSLDDVTLVTGRHAMRVDMSSSFTAGDRFLVRRLRAESEGSEFEASGEMVSVSRRTGKFTIDARTLDLDRLLAFMTAATPAGATQAKAAGAPGPSPAAVPFQIEMGIRARQGRLLGAAFSNLTTICRMDGGDVLLDDLQVDLFGGHYKGGLAFRGSGREPSYEWRGTVENLDVPQLVAFAGAPGSITGRLGGTMAISAPGADPLQAMRSARGTARVAITDGRVPGLDVVRNVILAFGRPAADTPAGSGEAFSRLAATLAVAGPRLSTSDLTFASRDFDMNGKGTISLASQALDLTVDVVLSRELSAQAGRDLYRLAREGDRIVLPAKITGTASAPSVFIDLQSALGRAIRNRAQDELKSLFDRLVKPPKKPGGS
jgi:uncharacterized protein involved in outer membrane biogenesis